MSGGLADSKGGLNHDLRSQKYLVGIEMRGLCCRLGSMRAAHTRLSGADRMCRVQMWCDAFSADAQLSWAAHVRGPTIELRIA